jgi:hypothetical protein
MFTYKLQFDNGARFQTTSKNMTETEAKVVKYIQKNPELTECLITCQGKTILVKKTGAWHPIHNGFIFTP